MKAYLDNGATTMVDPKVVDAMNPFFTERFGNASSLHKLGRTAHEALESSRLVIAKKLNALPEEIIFTSGGTESDNLAIKEVAFHNIKKKNHIITTKIEHPAVLNTCRFLEKMGFEITYLNVNHEGFIDLPGLEKSIKENTCLVSIIHANNEIGTIQDIKAIGEICKKHNVAFHTDAVQSFTKVPIDTKKIPVDLISLSAHKIHGPKGIGALYVRKGTPLHSLFHGGSQEANLRPGTENIPGIVGFAKAVELASEGHIKKMEKLRDYLIQEIKNNFTDIEINGPEKNRLCNNINISFKGIEGESLLMHLDEKGIAVSTGSACSSQSLEPSHVLLAIGLKPEVAHGSVRFTLSRFTTREELDYALKSLTEIVKNLRQISPLAKQ